MGSISSFCKRRKKRDANLNIHEDEDENENRDAIRIVLFCRLVFIEWNLCMTISKTHSDKESMI